MRCVDKRGARRVMITYIYSPPTENIWSPWSVFIFHETVHWCPLSRALLLVFRQGRDHFHFLVFWKCVCIINLGGSVCVRTEDKGGGLTINHEDEEHDTELRSSDLQTSDLTPNTSGLWPVVPWWPALRHNWEHSPLDLPSIGHENVQPLRDLRHFFCSS